jgi:hypothetical protein
MAAAARDAALDCPRRRGAKENPPFAVAGHILEENIEKGYLSMVYLGALLASVKRWLNWLDCVFVFEHEWIDGEPGKFYGQRSDFCAHCGKVHYWGFPRRKRSRA